MRLIAFVTEIGSITRILAYLGEPTKAPHIAPATRGPPDWEGDFDTREGPPKQPLPAPAQTAESPASPSEILPTPSPLDNSR